jgi:hypothetical protein
MSATIPNAQCPVAELARRQVRNISDYQRLEVERGYDHQWMRKAFEKIPAAEEEALTVQATSLEGAMFQIMLAFANVDCLESLVTGIGSNSDAEAQQSAGRLHAQIARYLYSAVAAIEAVSAVPREELVDGR